MQVLDDLAKVYSLDRERARTVGILHDAAKELTLEQQMELVEEAKIRLYYPCDHDPLYLHGPVGAYLISRELGITDHVILDTISVHTYYGDGVDLSPLCWCLRFADLVEPARKWRDWPVIRKLRELAYSGRMEEGALFQTQWLVEWFEENGTPVHPNMRRICQELGTLDIVERE
jgi:predicted HD superfamily hydrolase involved in NAD metabolism